MDIITIWCDRSDRSSRLVHYGIGKAYFRPRFWAIPCTRNHHTRWPRLTLRGEVALKARGARRLHLKISAQKKPTARWAELQLVGGRRRPACGSSWVWAL